MVSQCLQFFHLIFSGIHRRATNQEIRKAYKAKVKEWHPDKSTDPEAQAKFVEINQAYELLSDPDRRRLYDNQGVTEDSPNFRAVSEPQCGNLAIFLPRRFYVKSMFGV